MLCCPLLGWAPEVYHFHLPWSAERSWVDQTPVREGDIYCVVVIQSDLQSRMPSTQEQVTLVGSLSSPLPATLGSKLPLQPTRRWSGVELGTCGKLESALRTEPPRCWFSRDTHALAHGHTHTRARTHEPPQATEAIVALATAADKCFAVGRVFFFSFDCDLVRVC